MTLEEFIQALKMAFIDFNKMTKADFIREMKNWPYFEIQPDTTGQKETLQLLSKNYQGVSEWLELHELERTELKSLLFFTEKINYKPYADRSKALLDFCRQVHPKLDYPFVQVANTPEILWGACEYYEAIRRLHATGYYGEPANESKSEQFKKISQNITACKTALKDNTLLALLDNQPEADRDLCQKFINGESDWKLFYTSFVLNFALKDSIENNDRDLNHHCQQYLMAWRHCERLTNKGENAGSYQSLYLSSDSSSVKSTRKGLKKSASSTTSKRKRGRPHKGAIVKKY